MLRHSTARISAALRRITGFYQARGRDPETEQAWLRVVISVLALGWCGYLIYAEGNLTPGLVLAVIAASVAAVVGIGMLIALARSRDHVVPLRYLGILTDMTAISVGMAGADEGGVPMIGVYLWVTVGNGFRFGPRYLLAAYWLQLLGFGLQLLIVPFWIEHRAIGLGLLLALAIVPLYVLVLLSRLTAQKDAAEQLSNAKSRFVANVSHELRTPLTGVFAVYELLRARTRSAEDRELIAMLGNAISTLRASVDAVLQMSKLEAGAEQTNPRYFNLWQFLREIEALARPQADTKKLALRLSIDMNLGPVVYGDPDHLSHVVGNLVNNALKFTHEGHVEISAFAVDAQRTRIEVRDTGIGIPPEQQERLFERFVQVDNSATRRYGGTGLGTSIARDLVELMGGTIGVKSTPGLGSTFWIDLPLGIPDDQEVREELGSRRNVQVIEESGSEHSNVTQLMDLLRHVGAQPALSDGAAELAPSIGPRAVVAAILHMRAANAAEYAERTGTVQTTPWIVVAPEYLDEERRRLIDLGAAQLLKEPVSHSQLKLSLLALANRGDAAGVVDAARTERRTAQPLTILLADDNPSNQMLLARILRNAGHSVRTVGRGDEAFDVMAEEQVDLAILDLNMPDMTGPDVVKMYRAASVGAKHLPIIILSADATAAARAESLQSGADDFLTKPVTAQALLSVIERVFLGHSDASSADGVDSPENSAVESDGLVDGERIFALRNIARGDRTFLDQYISAAFSEIESAISDVQRAAKRGQLRAARDALHIIEGTGASLGGVELVRSCDTVRRLLPELQNPGNERVLIDFADVFRKTKDVVLASVNDGGRGAETLKRVGE